MAHYAFLNDDNIVTEVIVGRGENEVVDGISDWETYYGNFRNQRCLRTSYNTQANQHTFGGEPFRGNYAGIGFEYREDLDAFIPPQTFPSWVLNLDTFQWDPPIPYPSDGKKYNWDEEIVDWVELEDA